MLCELNFSTSCKSWLCPIQNEMISTDLKKHKNGCETRILWPGYKTRWFGGDRTARDGSGETRRRINQDNDGRRMLSIQ